MLIAAVAAAGAALVAAGHGPLAAPPADPRSWGGWLEALPPEAAVLAAVRLLALVAGAHIAATTLAAVLAGALRAHRVVTVLERLALPGGGALVRRAAAAGLLLTTLVPGAAAATTAGPDDPPVLRPLDDPAPTPAPAPPNGAVAAGAPDTAAVGEWLVRPGDHLWAVAEGSLTRAWGRAPTDAEVVPYWVEVVEANRRRLADPANPDLVFPGQVLVVPPVPSAP